MLIILGYSFGQEDKKNNETVFDTSNNSIENTKQNLIKVMFEDRILYWDSINNNIVKDENYLKILSDTGNICTFVTFVKNEEIVAQSVCSKKTPLKKGDIVYLFLRENGMVSTFQCLAMDFDSYDNCEYPYGLLDFIEKKRTYVFERVMLCMRCK